ncbi:MAG: Mov34/MPN/PAD-1 family protein, partial [Thaumarchaeota archaeon]|nr:Mov34/MPN/PAD-1 family protein [Nitrososphaerota archaeon]
MVIKIGRRIFDDVHAHAKSTYPEECCGLLISKENKEIVESVRMRNAFTGPKHDRYHIDPLELFKADREVAKTVAAPRRALSWTPVNPTPEVAACTSTRCPLDKLPLVTMASCIV